MGQTKGFEPGFGRRLKFKRKALGLTQRAVADYVGTNGLTVIHWEKERQTPSANIFKLAEVLETTPLWIMKGVEEKQAAASKGETQAALDTKANVAGEITPIAHGILIPMLGHVAAGSGAVVEPGHVTEKVYDLGTGAAYALRVKGDSMEPVLSDGSLIYCKKVELRLPPFEADVPFQVPAEKVAPFSGKFCVVILNGEGLVKRMVVTKQRGGRYLCTLQSLNPMHRAIKVSATDDCFIQGVAVALYREL